MTITHTDDRVFLDTECLGLDPRAPIWEFAALRREQDGYVTATTQVEIFIQHDPYGWLDSPDFPESFRVDYRTRYDPDTAVPEQDAAEIIASYTTNAVIHGSNPSFDMERLETLLRRNKIEPGWHYHPVDVPTLTQGYLAAKGKLPNPPWRSDALSIAAGVDPGKYARHTALGDVLWTAALYDMAMGVYA